MRRDLDINQCVNNELLTFVINHLPSTLSNEYEKAIAAYIILCRTLKMDPDYVVYRDITRLSTLEEVTGQYYWKQVTDASTLTIGNTYCIANIENAVALSTTQNNNNRGQCSIDLVDGTFGDNDSIQKITLSKNSKTKSFSSYLYYILLSFIPFF